VVYRPTVHYAYHPCDDAVLSVHELAGMVWALHQPQAGLVEPDDIDHEAVLAIAKPYLGELVGVYGNWSPLQNRGPLFAEVLALDDPWQFKNFRVL